jgi:hypothetical protein
MKSTSLKRLIGEEGRDSCRMSGTGETDHVAMRRLGSPHTLRKASPVAEINLIQTEINYFQEQQRIQKQPFRK